MGPRKHHPAFDEMTESVLGRGLLARDESRWTLHRMLILLSLSLTIIASLLFAGADPRRLIRPEAIPFLVSVVLVAPLVWREGPLTYLLAGIGVAFLPATVLYETHGQELLEPAATTGFVSNLLLLAAIVIGVPSGLHGAIETTKGMRLVYARRALRTRHGIVALSTLTLLLGAAATSYLAGGHAGDALAGQGAGFDVIPIMTLDLSARDNNFSPARLDVPAGKPTEIVLTNHDTLLHTFDYETSGKRYSHEVFPGATTRFVVLMNTTADVPFSCKYHKPGMVGTMRVDAAN